MSLGENYFATIIKRSLILILIISGIVLLMFENPKPYLKGLVFGSSINLLNFRLMYLSIKKSVKLSSKSAQANVSTGYFKRYTIYAITLIVASLQPTTINIFTMILGFFIVKIVILSDAFYDATMGKIRKK